MSVQLVACSCAVSCDDLRESNDVCVTDFNVVFHKNFLGGKDLKVSKVGGSLYAAFVCLNLNMVERRFVKFGHVLTSLKLKTSVCRNGSQALQRGR